MKTGNRHEAIGNRKEYWIADGSTSLTTGFGLGKMSKTNSEILNIAVAEKRLAPEDDIDACEN